MISSLLNKAPVPEKEIVRVLGPHIAPNMWPLNNLTQEEIQMYTSYLCQCWSSKESRDRSLSLNTGLDSATQRHLLEL